MKTKIIGVLVIGLFFFAVLLGGGIWLGVKATQWATSSVTQTLANSPPQVTALKEQSLGAWQRLSSPECVNAVTSRLAIEPWIAQPPETHLRSVLVACWRGWQGGNAP